MRIRSAHLGWAVTILLGLLLTRALLSRNPVEIRMGRNLVPSDNGHDLRFTSDEMKGHGNSRRTSRLNSRTHGRPRRALQGAWCP